MRVTDAGLSGFSAFIRICVAVPVHHPEALAHGAATPVTAYGCLPGFLSRN